MARVHHFGRNPSPHTRDEVMQKCVEDFLSALTKSHKKLSWIGTRSTDYIRLEALFGGLILKLTHVVPEDHKEYKLATVTGGTSGVGPEEYRLKLRDKFHSFGRAIIIDEYFEKNSPLFKEISAVFSEIYEGARFIESNVTNRIGLPQCIEEAGKILFSI